MNYTDDADELIEQIQQAENGAVIVLDEAEAVCPGRTSTAVQMAKRLDMERHSPIHGDDE